MTSLVSFRKVALFYQVIIRCVLLCLIFVSGSVSASMDPKPEDKREIVVLVHGLMRTPLSMWPLKYFLEKQGYKPYLYGYISSRYSLHEHSLMLKEYIEGIEKENPGKKIHFITHSMGGILVREAVSSLSNKQLSQIDSLVMLAPPNHGSAVAKYTVKILPVLTYFVKPLPELSSDSEAYVHRVPVPKMKIGVIAGRYDAKVPVSSAYLHGASDLAVIDSTHSFIMMRPKAMRLVVSFLQKGSFATT